MKILELAFTVYPVTDLKRARAFYEGVLGLTPTMVFEQETMGWIEYEIGPGTLAIGFGAPGFEPSKHGGCAALEVDDFDAAVQALKGAKCSFVLEPMDTPMCRMAVISDPDGNSLLVHKRKA